MRPAKFDVSPPLREIPPRMDTGHRPGHTVPNKRLPPDLNPAPGGRSGASLGAAPPFLLQEWSGTGPLMPAPLVNFEGVGEGLSGYNASVAPPDTEGDVGPNYYVQWVNLHMAIFDKSTGSIVYGPTAGNTIWSGFGGPCDTDNDGDPVVQYDQLAGRWVISQFAVNSGYAECIAVSVTGDPTGQWYRYAFTFSDFPDYPKLAMWPDGYYVTYNMFTAGGSWLGAEACAYERSAMLNGQSAQAVCFGPYSSYGGMLAADLDGSTLPPAGSPEYVIAKEGFSSSGSNLLLWEFRVDWTTPSNSTFTGPTSIAVASFTPACGGGTCIPQLGTTQQLDSLADRLMYRLAYRNYGTHEAMVVNHSVDPGDGRSGIRWYELRKTTGSWSLYQSGTFAPTDGHYRWMGSIAMDHVGNLAIGYSVSDSGMNPSIWYVGRLAGDPLNQLPQAEQVLLNGTGSQTTNLSRWGDYSALTVDPSDDCTFWFTTEYLSADGTFNWHTRIGAFKFSDCTVCSLTAPSGLTASASGDNAIQVSWGAVSGASEYRVYRSTTPGGPYTQVGTTTSTSYLDNTVEGGVTYYYVVTAYSTAQACESPYSTEVSATATGSCNLPPVFSGLASAAASTGTACAIDLSWSAATAQCAGPVTYAIYRSTTSGFTPDASTRIASGVTTTSYTDSSGLASGTTYYYVVRAVDGSNGLDDGNTVERSSGVGSGTPIDESFASGDPPSGWTLVNGGSGSQRWTTTNPGGRSAPSGITPPFEIIDSDYDGRGKTQDDSLITPAFSAAGATQVTLEFDTYYRDYDNNDFAYVDVSSDGGSTWTNVVTWDTKDVGSSTTASHQTLDITAAAAGSSNVKVRFHYVGKWGWYWMVDNVRVRVVGSCAATPSAVQVLTARSTSGQVKLEWVNPSGTYGVTRICRDTAGYPADPAACTVVADRVGAAGAYDSYTDTGLTDGTTYYYAAFVNSAADGSGTWSGGRTVWARPFATTGKVTWSYHTGESALQLPGLYPGALGTGAGYVVSNDRMLHGMNSTGSGGDWPRTAPYAWAPAAMNQPAQSRPPVVPITVGSSDLVVFLGSEDGHAYAVDARTGATLWRSPQLASMLVGSPAGIFGAFGGSMDLLFVGTRDATVDNVLYALDPSTGAVVWSWNNGGGAGGIGIISSTPAVDYTANRVYFTSRARSGGSSDTVWCLSVSSTGASKVWSVAVGDADASPVVYGGRVYVGTNDGTVYALDAATGAVLASYATGDGAVKGFVMPEFSSTLPRHLYLATTTRVWSLLDSGSSITSAWSTTAVPGPSTPMVVPGTSEFYVGSSDGRLYQLDTATGAVVASVVLGDGTAAVGSPARDPLSSFAYVGTESGAIYGVALPLK